MMANVLVVDGDAASADELASYLRQCGHAASAVCTAEEGIERAGAGVDLVLVSAPLPDLSETEMCRELRARRATRNLPIIMLSASNDEIDRVVSFEVGVDDYVAKPCSLRELELRVRAVMRRKPTTAPVPKAVRVGALQIDPAAHRVSVNDEEVAVSALELRLLVALEQRRGRVCSREMLLEVVWSSVRGVSTRTVDACVKRLRRKLGPAGRYIETVRGVGYRFTDTT